MAKILIISPTPTHPQDAGNRARIFSLLSVLKAAGHIVSLAFVKMEVGDETAMNRNWDEFFSIPYQQPRDRWLKRTIDCLASRHGFSIFLPYRIDDWYLSEISRQLIKIREQLKPDVVIVEYVFLSKAFECFGEETLKILDTHDIFGNRHRFYLEHGMTPQWFYTTTAEEKKALDRADLILAIQNEEAAYFSRLTDRKVITAGHMFLVAEDNEKIGDEADCLLFVGSANPINVAGLQWFLDEIFPQVRLRIPEMRLEAVGECAKMVSPVEGFIQTGSVADLTPYYRQAKAVINPIRFGSGLKIKTVEALAMGRPLVTTAAGAAGLAEWDGKAFLVANNAMEFAEKIQKVCSSQDLRSTLAKNAREFTKKNNIDAMKSLVDGIEQFSENKSNGKTK